MRSQLSERWFSSNWGRKCGGFTLLFKLRGGGGGGRIQEEGDECSSCNKETTGVKPPPPALLGPHGDTCCHAGDAEFRFQSCFFMPPIRKHGKKYCRFLPSNQRRGIHVTTITTFAEVCTQYSENKSGSFLQLTLLCHWIMIK